MKTQAAEAGHDVIATEKTTGRMKRYIQLAPAPSKKSQYVRSRPCEVDRPHRADECIDAPVRIGLPETECVPNVEKQKKNGSNSVENQKPSWFDPM